MKQNEKMEPESIDIIKDILGSKVTMPRAMPREAILRAAISCVCDDREKQYGEPKRNFEVISRFWSTYLGINLHPMDVSMMMALLKIARIVTGGVENADSYIDAAGYIALAAETGGGRTPAEKYIKASDAAEVLSEKLNISISELVDIFAEIPRAGR